MEGDRAQSALLSVSLVAVVTLIQLEGPHSLQGASTLVTLLLPCH